MVWDRDDEHLIRGGKDGYIPITGDSQLRGLISQAEDTMRIFQRIVEPMSQCQAKFVRRLRVNEGYTWRAVARACHEERWSNISRWGPPSNQLMGMALCERAAQILGEDFGSPPWN